MYGFALIRPQGGTRTGTTEMTETKVGINLKIKIDPHSSISKENQLWSGCCIGIISIVFLNALYGFTGIKV